MDGRQTEDKYDAKLTQPKLDDPDYSHQAMTSDAAGSSYPACTTLRLHCIWGSKTLKPSRHTCSRTCPATRSAAAA